jgi:hypothetical protein
VPVSYWDRAFDEDSDDRQGELLAELAELDPALDSNPVVDRYLISRWKRVGSAAAPQYPELGLPSARRRAYFEWEEQDVVKIDSSPGAFTLVQGLRHDEFRRIALMSDTEQDDLRARLCRGIAQLESLPQRVLQRVGQGVVPLKILPRTPVETVFWVEKPIANFKLNVDRPFGAYSVDWMPNEVHLSYLHLDGQNQTVLRMNSALFGMLLDLADGFQLIGETGRDIFANLAVFTQRLAEETQEELFALEPSASDQIQRIWINKQNLRQVLTFTSLLEANND